MRISDSDRNRAVEELRRHCAAGRLSIDDLEARVAEAAAAETLADLDHALRDLPLLRIAAPESFATRAFSSHAGSSSAAHDAAEAARIVPAATATALSLGVGAAAVSLAVLSHWVWAVLLVTGWLIGLLQGAVRRHLPRS